jgi:hypothetical protein
MEYSFTKLSGTEKTLLENRVSAVPRYAAARTLRLIALLRKVFLIKVFAVQR